MEEKKILKLNSRREKVNAIRNQARKCLNDKVVVTNIDGNLSRQLFEDAPTLYMNPTERLKISNLDLNGAKLLTVLSSGDFLIEGIFHGANEIVTFDINRNQYYPASLKVKGLQNMSYEEYYNFFSNIESKDYLSEDVYKKLKRISENNPNLYAFCDLIFSQREIDRKRFYQALNSFGLDFDTMKILGPMIGLKAELNEVELEMALSRMNVGYPGSTTFRTISGLSGLREKDTYLENEESYKLAQEKIKDVDISFVKSDIARITNVLKSANANGKYDSIYLSNIPEYLNGNLFMYIVENQLMPLLEDDGVIEYVCQSTSIDTLKMSDKELKELTINAKILEDGTRNMFSLYQMINSVEAYKYLSDNYNISLEEVDTASLSNGIESKDTFVYIKK